MPGEGDDPVYTTIYAVPGGEKTVVHGSGASDPETKATENQISLLNVMISDSSTDTELVPGFTDAIERSIVTNTLTKQVAASVIAAVIETRP